MRNVTYLERLNGSRPELYVPKEQGHKTNENRRPRQSEQHGDQQNRGGTDEVQQLENDVALLSAELIARQDEMVALQNMTQAMRCDLTLDGILEKAIDHVLKMFAIDGVFLFLDQPHRIERKEIGLTDAEIEAWQIRVVQQGSDLLGEHEEFNILAAPIWIGESIHGVIGLSKSKPFSFSAPDRKLLENVVGQVSVFIENISLHQDAIEQAIRQAQVDADLSAAQRVQSRLLPQTKPRVDGLELAARLLPAREVGGDFYDFMIDHNGSLIMSVGDVSGKGMPAALLTGMVRTTLRNITQLTPDHDPDQWIESANGALYNDFTDVHMLATMFICRFDPKMRRIIFANAGHSPVVFCPVLGPARLLEADGTALGVLETNFCKGYALPLGEGNLMVAGTDGLVEARNSEGEMFGYERLLNLISNARQDSADALADRILSKVAEFNGDTPRDDDQTVLVMRGIG